MIVVKKMVHQFGLPRLVMTSFLLLLLLAARILNIPFALIISQSIVRIGINMVLVLAMVPSINSGIGLNFGLPIGILCGLMAGMISLEYNFTGVIGILGAILISIPFSVIAGYLYGLLLNKVKGSELMVGTYVAFSMVSLLCIGWMLFPFKHPRIRWPMGRGLRVTITLDGWYDRALNQLGLFTIGGIEIPTGLLIICAFLCFIVWMFFRSRTGIMMLAVGRNPHFAKFKGVDVDRMRILGSILTTILGGIGIIIYAQGFGFYQLFTGPLMMAFPAVAAVLIGGATTKKISIFNVVFGTVLFQSILTIAAPVASSIFTEGNLSEVFRAIASNGVILYALSKMMEVRK